MLVRQVEAYAAEVGAVAQVRGGGLQGDGVAEATGGLYGALRVGRGQRGMYGDAVPGEQFLGLGGGQGQTAGVGVRAKESLDQRGGARLVDVVVLPRLAGLGRLPAPPRIANGLREGAVRALATP